MEARIITRGNKLPKRHLVASVSEGFAQKTMKCIVSVKQGIHNSGSTGDVVCFLATTAALEILRRISRAKCPFIWRGLQMLQVLCFPPFEWLQKFPLLGPLVKHIQKLSRPMFALSIATLFSYQSECNPEASDPLGDSSSLPASIVDPSSQFPDQDTRPPDEVAKCASEEWLVQLDNELNKLGITRPERLDEDEIRRRYDAVNGDFSRLLSSVRRTIDWRQSYSIFSLEELENWSHLVFWHGRDMKQRPCLIIRLGRACSTLRSDDRPLFVKAIVSQIDYGIVNLVTSEHSQITVLMDCDGLAPFGFPIQMMKSCSELLQDHYPNRLGCLMIVRLPQVARVVTQTLFQVLKPATRQKLKIIGGNYQEVLSEFLQSPPSFLGGACTCTRCSDTSIAQIPEGNNAGKQAGDAVISDADSHLHTDTRLGYPKEQIGIVVIIGMVLLWLLAFFWATRRFPEEQKYSVSSDNT